MEVNTFVLCCALFAAAAAFTLPDQVTEYNRKDDLLKIVESQACKCKNGRCVTDNRGKTKCNCPPGYALQDEFTCEPCSCGERGKCMFIPHPKSAGGVLYEKKCLCDQGSAEKDGTCVPCQCGENSKCEFEGDEKICYCIDGYSEKDGVCTRCDCGFNGECNFELGQKKCTCDDGFLEHAGNCKECNCGEFGKCSLPNGNKVCSCNKGFSDNNGVCEKCDCGEKSLACGFTNGEKKCTCKPNKAQKGELCVDCKCGAQSSGCSFLGEKKLCECLEGYVQKNDGTCRVKCGVNNPCQNGGSCNGGICKCLPGTSGEFCENIDGCDKLCPKVPGIECAFNPTKLESYCKCTDGKMGFHDETQTCKPTCNDQSSICSNGGKCVTKSDGDYSSFCRCLDGTEGDFCEEIPGCYGKDCGLDASCGYDTNKLSAFCKCRDTSQTFDPKDRKCKRSCEEEMKCENGGKCSSRGNSHFCDCLPGTSGDHCDIVDECVKAVDVCKGESKCAYDAVLEKAFCDCPDGKQKYDPMSGECKYTCSEDANCKNGGLCMHRGDNLFCHCKVGTSGTFCEIVDDCERGVCGDRVSTTCDFDVQSESVKCGCKNPSSLYDPNTKQCKVCDCGRNAVSCKFEQGQKVCSCKEGYADEIGTCKKKFCTEKKCLQGKCEVIGDEEEVCKCYEGFELEGDYCRKLNCSKTPCENGTCIVRQGKFEQCICPAGHTLRFGACIRGMCSMHTCFGGRCQKVDGELMCVCPERYNLEGVGCFETVCKKQYCFGGKCVVKNDEEICTCPEHHVLVGNVCKRILCERKDCFGGFCSVVQGEEVCTCPQGHVLVDDVCRRV